MRVGGGESWWGAGGGEWEGVGTVEEDGAHGQGRGRGEVEGGRADGERRTARVLETSDFPGVCCQVLPGAASGRQYRPSVRRTAQDTMLGTERQSYNASMKITMYSHALHSLPSPQRPR